MARPLRILYPGAVYHAMNRGLARQPVFRTTADRRTFLTGLAEAHTLWGLEVYAYCRPFSSSRSGTSLMRPLWSPFCP